MTDRDDRRRETLRVLLVEHSGTDARLIRELLDRGVGWNYLLQHVATVEEGIQVLGSFDPSCVLMAVEPSHDAAEHAVVQMRRKAPDKPLIILTRRDDQEAATVLIRHGVEDVIAKGGLDSDTLTRAIRFAIERRQSVQGELTPNRRPTAGGRPDRLARDGGFTAQDFLDRIRKGRTADTEDDQLGDPTR